ncbi:hypothetical protein SKAU_G00229120 [Synaphobranchus kaupii]|uniref:Uncharacterized protein n=1 Tax=Synaphobranchus kaupii TaxID=118154 RepID=A0A9Q1F596_SYNKA|nr:hypothetical protein SKAU_G00229120 [Synaphobranchus kaupii]
MVAGWATPGDRAGLTRGPSLIPDTPDASGAAGPTPSCRRPLGGCQNKRSGALALENPRCSERLGLHFHVAATEFNVTTFRAISRTGARSAKFSHGCVALIGPPGAPARSKVGARSLTLEA